MSYMFLPSKWTNHGERNNKTARDIPKTKKPPFLVEHLIIQYIRPVIVDSMKLNVHSSNHPIDLPTAALIGCCTIGMKAGLSQLFLLTTHFLACHLQKNWKELSYEYTEFVQLLKIVWFAKKLQFFGFVHATFVLQCQKQNSGDLRLLFTS